jgi:hypothetical protein
MRVRAEIVEPQPERLKSPLEIHEVRLRGLHRGVCARCDAMCRADVFAGEASRSLRGFPPSLGRLQSLGAMAALPQDADPCTALAVTRLKPRSASAASRDGAYRFPSGGFSRSGRMPAFPLDLCSRDACPSTRGCFPARSSLARCLPVNAGPLSRSIFARAMLARRRGPAFPLDLCSRDACPSARGRFPARSLLAMRLGAMPAFVHDAAILPDAKRPRRRSSRPRGHCTSPVRGPVRGVGTRTIRRSVPSYPVPSYLL